jgi:hypothetical protein
VGRRQCAGLILCGVRWASTGVPDRQGRAGMPARGYRAGHGHSASLKHSACLRRRTACGGQWPVKLARSPGPARHAPGGPVTSNSLPRPVARTTRPVAPSCSLAAGGPAAGQRRLERPRSSRLTRTPPGRMPSGARHGRGHDHGRITDFAVSCHAPGLARVVYCC